MTPGNPRHGERLRYNRGCRCDDCRAAAARYERGRQWDIINGRSRSVPIIGPRRRMQALVALGWDYHDQGRHLGVSGELIRAWATSRTFMYRRTAERIAAMYDELSMRLPPQETTSQKNKVARARSLAQRKGYAPPLAWDNIDDPDEQPQGVGVSTIDRAETLRDLADMGYGITEAMRRLDLNRDAMQKWCANHGLADVYRALARREAVRGNQWSEEGAA